MNKIAIKPYQMPMLGKHHSLKTKNTISRSLKKYFKENPNVSKSYGKQVAMRWRDPNSILNSKEHRQLLSDNMFKRMQLNPKREGLYRGVKRGYYDINGKKIFFRSLWEANYALYLDFLIKQKQIKSWQYEVDTFWFEKIRRGIRSYKPDFKIQKNNDTFEYHEVKGWMDAGSITKTKRMAKYHPEIKLIVVDGDCYKDIKSKVGKMLKFYVGG